MSLPLAELHLKTSYHKGEDDIAADFYLPCMERSNSYDRAVGFFRSSIFSISWPALLKFISNQGRIRFICSTVLADEDVAALDEGYAARTDRALERQYLGEVKSLLNEPALRVPAQVLAGLVAGGMVDFRIAVLKHQDYETANTRIFHDKLGIFRDENGAAVVFKGSMNETWTGLSADGNLESVDVAATWMGDRDSERVQTETNYFERLWVDDYPRLNVRPFPEVAREELRNFASSDWERTLEEALNHTSPATGSGKEKVLRPHQAAGLASWRGHGRRGVLAFATGSGKTFTAIKAIEAALEEHGEVAVVVVPDTVLFDQWDTELSAELSKDLKVLRAGAGHDGWRPLLRDWTAKAAIRRLVLVTLDTAASPDFIKRVTPGEHLFLVVDEVHRAGSPYRSGILDGARFRGARLGLSATPERAGDTAGTELIKSFFERVLEPRYGLQEAIRDGVLSKYFYRPWAVTLADEEIAAWEELTTRIGRLYGAGSSPDEIPDRLRHLLIQRARIVKKAAGKTALAAEVLSEAYEPGQRWIVYCDDLDQLRAVQRAIERMNLPVVPFHSTMKGDREQTLQWLSSRGGIVTAIRCLDEGVDIPSVTHALILASSQNPREFIQRRGRVLRRAEGKSLAYVHDAIVVPPSTAKWDALSAAELARAVEFASHAENPGAGAKLRALAVDMGVDINVVMNLGVETDDESN